MDLYFIIFASVLVFIFIWRIKGLKIIHFKSLIIPAFCVIFIICLIAFSSTAVKAALKGINLWLYVVFPSLFPFFVGSRMLQKSGFVNVMGALLEPLMRPLFNVPGCGSFAFAMGITSGYPMGAIITNEMRQGNLLTKNEAERLLAFTNNSGPLFIVGAVSVGMLNMPQLGLLLLGCHIAACVTVGILFRFYANKEKTKKSPETKKIFRRAKEEYRKAQKNKENLGSMFGDAVKDSIVTMLSIGGFIILFSVIINVLIEIGFVNNLASALSVILIPLGIQKEVIASLVGGFFEITTGSNMVSLLQNIPLNQKLAAASMVIGWAGLSVHSQVLSIISKSDISLKPYLFGKLLQGIFAAIYTYILSGIFGARLIGAKQVFLPAETAGTMQWYNYLLNSFEFLAISLLILVVFIIAALLIRLKKYIFN